MKVVLAILVLAAVCWITWATVAIMALRSEQLNMRAEIEDIQEMMMSDDSYD